LDVVETIGEDAQQDAAGIGRRLVFGFLAQVGGQQILLAPDGFRPLFGQGRGLSLRQPQKGRTESEASGRDYGFFGKKMHLNPFFPYGDYNKANLDFPVPVSRTASLLESTE
jgi:hypothetical protein